MTFDEWVEYGVREGFSSNPVCGTHDLAPLTPEETEEMDAGGDPCVPIVRLWT